MVTAKELSENPCFELLNFMPNEDGTFGQSVIFNSKLEKDCARINEVKLISGEGEPAKWHIDIFLPTGISA
ncbi:hypothetical protein FACS18945_5830 [Bacteroidia bacterium]|nr:hypothetical protein FACS18945_5830 [Bacteroidia bacterium]